MSAAGPFGTSPWCVPAVTTLWLRWKRWTCCLASYVRGGRYGGQPDTPSARTLSSSPGSGGAFLPSSVEGVGDDFAKTWGPPPQTLTEAHLPHTTRSFVTPSPHWNPREPCARGFPVGGWRGDAGRSRSARRPWSRAPAAEAPRRARSDGPREMSPSRKDCDGLCRWHGGKQRSAEPCFLKPAPQVSDRSDHDDDAHRTC